MADVSEEVPIKDAATAISQGKRHLLVRDYNLAVVVLAQACELLAQEHGETGDEMGELYLLYGRALLELAREEAGVLGGGVPGESEEASQDEQGEDEEDEEDEESEEITGTEANSSTASAPCMSNGKDDKEESITEEKSGDSKDTKTEKNEESEKTEKFDKTIKEKNKQKEEIPSCSKDLQNGEASCSGLNKEKDDEATKEDVEKENDEDEVNNLQIAWEVLELAKLVLLKRGSAGWKKLAEAYSLLGQVAMESSNHESALTDFKACLNLLEKMTPRDHRAIAEIHYQMGVAHSIANNFDASIEQFNQASALLEAKIVYLKTLQDDPPQSDDPFYTVEGEIKELQDLLPEIQEKIADIKDQKKEADVIKKIKEEANGCSSNAEAKANEASGSGIASKPVSDISHLVRKKRKAEDEESNSTASPCKKSMQEKDVA
ncbi:nuclear autoantigenic sperm protein [Pseudomyrmex gracilis]|uniref:nuclear autoantigenic sperm protein n=1 Tax=Pseudomyrmex gracilis TaxID=219809 RepID=UPI000994CD0C|nr:nuclear autoantigenic sperm protein [Pseudomyrmex gracilis]